ncbi:MAG: SusE domain-containing protein [Prevotellaceae bacterium]|nr:SusE domain-containing protein [Prevotellaceae bacterium]
MAYKEGEVVASGGPSVPKDSYYIELQAGAGVATSFSWLPGACEDGYPVQYEVVFFDQPANGREVERVDAGFKTSINISHKQLNSIASEAGVEPNQVGSLYWTVNVSRGLTEAISAQRYNLEVKRLLGFSYIPPTIYLVGSGTEGGSNAADAVPFRTVGDGEYEIYTQFSAGEYLIVDDPQNPEHSYAIQGSQAIETTAAVTAPSNGIYRITLDFNVKAAILEQVTSVNHWFCTKSELTPMEYAGRGVWVLRDHYLDANDYWVAVPPGSQDDRYHFRATLAGNALECWGPVSSGEDGKPSSIDPANEYFQLKPYTIGAFDQWGPKFKYHASVCEKTVDIYVDMAANPPTHRFVLK